MATTIIGFIKESYDYKSGKEIYCHIRDIRNSDNLFFGTTLELEESVYKDDPLQYWNWETYIDRENGVRDRRQVLVCKTYKKEEKTN